MSSTLIGGKTLADELVQGVLDGCQHIVSHTGTSQYKGGTGSSACGLAALNFARVILAKVNAGQIDILQEIIAKETIAKVSNRVSCDSGFLTYKRPFLFIVIGDPRNLRCVVRSLPS